MDILLRFSIAQRWLILLIAVAIGGLGVYNYRHLPIDAVPDITHVQVQVMTEAPGYSPLEVEQRITYPIENALGGLPHLEGTRSLSRYGLSAVTVVFEDGTDLYFARQLVNERVQAAQNELPPGAKATLGPISTGLGEIFMWSVEADSGAVHENGQPITGTDLRTVQDWVIKPQLRNIPGVTEVNSIGGYEKQFQVAPDPQRLLAYGLSLRDLISALAKNNANLGAGYIERNGEQYLIRSPGQIGGMEDVRNIVVGGAATSPVRMRDVAEVFEGMELRTGAATKNGKETVIGTVFMLLGENSREVSQRVAAKMESLQGSLPKGIRAVTVYDRTNLVDKAIATVKMNLIEGAVLVIVILFLFLGNLRAALITAMVIPLSMLFTISGMVQGRITGNLMSLGALDFGLIVDGAVIIVENCIRQLAHRQKETGGLLPLNERLRVVHEATREVMRPSVFGVLIIMVVYLPILTLTGVEGKMFRPMAMTVIIALAGALIFSLTLVPATVAIFLSRKISEKESGLQRGLKNIYSNWLDKAMQMPVPVLTFAVVLLGLSGLAATRMGSEFVPQLDEGDVALHAMRIPGTSLTQAVNMQIDLEKRIQAFPEVKTVFSKLGTAEVATDPMPPSVADGFVMLKDRSEWPNPKRTKADFVRELEDSLRQLPGNNYEFTQPIQMRFNELIAGVRSDVAVKIFGDDMRQLEASGEVLEKILAEIPGASDVKAEATTGLPMMTLALNREAMASHGLSVEDVHEVIEIALAGKVSGEIFEGDRRFDLLVRLPDAMRADPEAIRDIPVPLGEQGGFIPLGSVLNITTAPGPNQVSRENGKRNVVVTANVRDRDLGSFVAEAQKTLAAKVQLPPGYWMEWGGQFENLISASRRLRLVIPIGLALILLLLYGSLQSLRNALLVFTGIPLALTGGIFALMLRGIPLSISAGVGFIALSGVAVLNGMVMVSFIETLRSRGLDLEAAIREGSLTRLRPVLMTALVASLGFVPMALATGTGAEVQRPLATVVIGGILSSTVLTLFVLPVIYRIFHRRTPSRPIQ